MNGALKLLGPLVATLAIAACNAGGSSNIPSSAAGGTQGSLPMAQHVPEWQAKNLARAACPQIVGKPACQVLISNAVKPDSCNPSSTCGFTPPELESYYGLTPYLSNGSGTIVAVIEIGDEPTASSDLATYRTQYGLGSANLQKYNEKGQQSNYPATCQDYSGGSWCVEAALDIEMVSASCPQCTIYLMEAKGNLSDLEAAEAEAVTLGAHIVSNSWGCAGSYDCGDKNFPNYFNTTGVAYLASTGDSGYNEIGGPSVLGTVIGVGGTQLRKEGSKYIEEVWSDAGAGCGSASVVGSNVTKPAWQHDPDCAYRTDGDVSAQAGLEPGVAEYTAQNGGWFEVGGTSVASPFTAGVIGLAGNASSQNGGEKFWQLSKKKHKSEFHVISEGADGSCGGEYLCKAGAAKGLNYKTYSGPAGWGTPNGIKAY